jgi:hypothetical protein
VHKENIVGSVGMFRRILELLNILRKEGFGECIDKGKEMP